MGVSSYKLAALWRDGVSLYEAIFVHAPKDMLAKYEAMPGFADALNDLDPEKGVPGVFDSLLYGLHNSTKKMEDEGSLSEALLDRIYSEELIAIGYPVQPRPTGKLKLIDWEYFDKPIIEWDKSTLQARGYKYEDVRVVRPDETLVSVRPKIGRPSNISEIKAAMAQIAKRDPDFCKLPRKIAAQKIRIELGAAGSDAGFSDKTLEKYIVPFCRQK